MSPSTDHPVQSPVRDELTPEQSLELARLLAHLHARHRESRDVGKALRAVLRSTAEFFDASEACYALVRPTEPEAQVAFSLPKDAEWDSRLLARFVHGEGVTVPRDSIFARFRRRGRFRGVLAVRAPGDEFGWEARRALSRIAVGTTELIDQIDRERLREVRARIDRKVMEQLRPKDLFYQILHGLRSLTNYDHSSSLLIYDESADVLEVAAEQIAWEKRKSSRIGLSLALTPDLRRLMSEGEVYGFRREGDEWHEWSDPRAAPLAQLLDYNRDAADEPRESAMLCAPLGTRDGVLGLLKVAALHDGELGSYEADLVLRFLPQASVAVRNSRRTESLEAQMIDAERKNAMGELARGISHDVNNALGSVLPLVQQLRADLASGAVDLAVAAQDLEHIEQSLQVCRRIFGGMLSFARGSARRTGESDVVLGLECALAILKDRIERRGIELRIDVADGLPATRGAQSDLEQVLLNLLTNAQEAMTKGDVLTIGVRTVGDEVEVVIEDTGEGISPEHMAKIHEPFYTTKTQGNGLGLSICRSIVWEMRGRMTIESEPGKGTRVVLRLPIVS